MQEHGGQAFEADGSAVASAAAQSHDSDLLHKIGNPMEKQLEKYKITQTKRERTRCTTPPLCPLLKKNNSMLEYSERSVLVGAH